MQLQKLMQLFKLNLMLFVLCDSIYKYLSYKSYEIGQMATKWMTLMQFYMRKINLIYVTFFFLGIFEKN